MAFDFKEITYNLPPEKIAVYPLANRADARLLHYKKGEITTSTFHQFDDFLSPDSVLYLNNTKVIYARLYFKTPTGAAIEILCLEPYDPVEYQLNFTSTNQVVWKVYIGNNKRWKSEMLSLEINMEGQSLLFKAKRIKPSGDAWLVAFQWDDKNVSFGSILESIGNVPLPPYLNRAAKEEDKIRYQTVFAKEKGSVAAPTAGLHLNEDLLERIKKKSITVKNLTLHVGAGTFKPIKNNDINQHKMHEEYFNISLEGLRSLRNQLVDKRKIIAVGTTALRTLESLYWIGLGLGQSDYSFNQWTPYQERQSDLPLAAAVIEDLIYECESANKDYFEARTPLLIMPGYSFKVVDALVTNFHQPESTLLLLVAAFIGEDWKKVYDFALNNNFRFLSFGDGSYLERN